jgi:hypothetical protein
MDEMIWRIVVIHAIKDWAAAKPEGNFVLFKNKMVNGLDKNNCIKPLRKP